MGFRNQTVVDCGHRRRIICDTQRPIRFRSVVGYPRKRGGCWGRRPGRLVAFHLRDCGRSWRRRRYGWRPTGLAAARQRGFLMAGFTRAGPTGNPGPFPMAFHSRRVNPTSFLAANLQRSPKNTRKLRPPPLLSLRMRDEGGFRLFFTPPIATEDAARKTPLPH